eukprot:2681000-Amphidinium_carterae.1
MAFVREAALVQLVCDSRQNKPKRKANKTVVCANRCQDACKLCLECKLSEKLSTATQLAGLKGACHSGRQAAIGE